MTKSSILQGIFKLQYERIILKYKQKQSVGPSFPTEPRVWPNTFWDNGVITFPQGLLCDISVSIL